MFRNDADGYAAAVGQEALDQVQDADRLIRSAPGHSERYRLWRTHAVAEALTAGIPIHQVADALGIPVSEVELMLQSVVIDTTADADEQTGRIEP
jgi:hypothetical protein